jgi:hypothetical protein
MNQIQHSGHCRACKERVREMLTTLYGECLISHSFAWSAKPEDYAGTSIGETLKQICAALGDLRGHRYFIKSPLVPPVDYYIPEQKLIVEFDESQHFTRPRLMTLSLYPQDVQIGFSEQRWSQLCRAVDANDDTPIDRDERRAWYDTLRDLIPALHGFHPTVRLYAEDLEWCSLDSRSARDIDSFRHAALL